MIIKFRILEVFKFVGYKGDIWFNKFRVLFYSYKIINILSIEILIENV